MMNVLCGVGIGMLVCNLVDAIWMLIYRKCCKGKWLEVNAINIDGIVCTRYRCSKCGKDSKDRTKYCGNCRAEMNLEE